MIDVRARRWRLVLVLGLQVMCFGLVGVVPARLLTPVATALLVVAWCALAASVVRRRRAVS